MLRIVIASLSVALCLQMWGTISSRFLPWPNVFGKPTLSAPSMVTVSANLSGSTFAPPAQQERTLIATNGDDWPIYAFYRNENLYLSESSQATYLAVNIALGLIVALVVAIIGFEGRAGRRRLAALCLLGLTAILLTDITQGIWMHWPRKYIAVLCTDHFVATVLAAGAATLVLHFWRTERAAADPAATSDAVPGAAAP